MKSPFSRVFKMIFREIARLVSTRPWFTIVVVLTVIFATFFGLLRTKLDTSLDMGWAPYKYHVREAKEAFDEKWGGIPPASTMVLYSDSLDDNVLQNNTAMLDLLDLEKLVLRIKCNSEGKTLSDFCYRIVDEAAFPCLLYSPWLYWNYDADLFKGEEDHFRTISQPAKTSSGLPLSPPLVFGGITHLSNLPSRVTSVKALRSTFVFDSDKASNKCMEDWNVQFSETVKSFKFRGNLKAVFLTSTGVKDEIVSEHLSQWWLAPAGICLTLIITITALCLSTGFVQGLLCAITGFGLNLVALVAAIALTSLFGIPISPVTLQVVPMLVMVVAVDSVYVLTQLSVDPSSRRLSSQYLAHCLEETGPVLMICCIVLISPFLVCLVTDVPIVWGIVFQVTLALVLDLILQVLVFPAFIIKIAALGKKTAHTSSRTCSAGHVYAKIMTWSTSVLGMIMVLVVLSICTAIACIGISRAEKGMSIDAVAADNSVLGTYERVDSLFFGNATATVFFISFDSKATNFEDPNVVPHLQHIKDEVERIDGTGTSLSSPLSVLMSAIAFYGFHKEEFLAADRKIPPEKLGPWLKELVTLVPMFRREVLFSGNSTTLLSVKFTGQVSAASLLKIAEALKNIYGVKDEGILWSPLLPFTAQFFDLDFSLIVTICCSFVTICVICALILWDWRLIVTQVISLAFIVVNCVGYLYFIDIQLNVVSMLSIVTGMGLASEYTLHLMWIFMSEREQHPSLCTHELILKSADKIGNSILLSFLSSFLGMIFVVLWSRTKLVRQYFAGLWAMIFLVGALYSFFLCPVILRLLGCCVKEAKYHEEDPVAFEMLVLKEQNEMDQNNEVQEIE